MRKSKFDFNLLLLKALVKTSHSLRWAYIAGFWLVLEVAVAIFLNPISAAAWFVFFYSNNEETTSRVSHETNHNIAWYNLWVTLPIISTIAFLTLLKRFLSFLIVSPQKHLILNTIKCDLPSTPEGSLGREDIELIDKAENELIAKPANYDLNLYSTAANYIQLSNRLFGGPKFYSQQLLSNEIFTVYYLRRFYGRFDSALFSLVGHTLAVTNRDITLLLLQMLQAKDLLFLMQTHRYYSTKQVYVTNHCRKFIGIDTDLNTAIPQENAALIIKSYEISRWSRIILDPTADIARRQVTAQDPDIENQLANITQILPELQQSNLCQPFLSDQDSFVDYDKLSLAGHKILRNG